MTPVELPGSIRITFGKNGNSHQFVGSGWSGTEPGHRWTTGKTSTLKIPALEFSGDALITFEAVPYLHLDRVVEQNLSIFFNEKKIDEFALLEGLHRYSGFVPEACISRSTTNTIELRHPNAARPRDVGGLNDSREIAISFSSVSIESDDLRLFPRASLFPGVGKVPLETPDLPTLAQRFQSLGQNCEFGLFQRRCGTEPLGLFRFSSIFLPQLLRGLETRFLEIGNVSDIYFENRVDEYLGRHKVYGLDYHTFTKPGDVDLDSFTKSQAARLAYLARRLMDQIENSEKIFVIQRVRPKLNLREVIPLLRVLRSYNEKIALLWVTEADPESNDLAGRVECLGSHFYHGYIDRLAPGEDAKDLSFDRWVELCRTVMKAVDAPDTQI